MTSGCEAPRVPDASDSYRDSVDARFFEKQNPALSAEERAHVFEDFSSD